MQTAAKTPRSKGSIWTDPKARAWIFQLVAIAVVVALGWFLYSNTMINLEKRGITTGFAFLNNTAGFGIAQHLVEYTETDSYGRVFLIGLLNTLLVSVIGIVMATLLGFILGIARLAPNWLISRLATVYIETFRNIPPLLQILFWYFAVMLSLPGPRQSLGIFENFYLNSRGLYVPAPSVSQTFGLFLAALAVSIVVIIFLARWAKARREATGHIFPVALVSIAILLVVPGLAVVIAGSPLNWTAPKLTGFNFTGGWVLIPELIALTLALTMYTAAFIAEIVRAGIQSVSHGQTEAASSLGLPPGRILRLVIIPQALRVIIPPLTSQYLNLAKNSSLAAAIGYPEMVSLFAGTVLNQTGQAIEVIAITMSVYLAISISISMLMNWYNKRIALIER